MLPHHKQTKIRCKLIFAVLYNFSIPTHFVRLIIDSPYFQQLFSIYYICESKLPNDLASETATYYYKLTSIIHVFCSYHPLIITRFLSCVHVNMRTHDQIIIRKNYTIPSFFWKFEFSEYRKSF